MPEERDWASIAVTQRPNLLSNKTGILTKDVREYQLTLLLLEGIGVSIVSRQPCEELLFAHFRGIALETVITPSGKTLDASVADIQCDNQV